MAEIARAGILSVDKGQMEAAQALGMSRGKAMRRIVLPQAMRVIVPPTGNETIAMLKDTSLLIGIPVGTELLPASGHRQPDLPSLPDPGGGHALLPDCLQRPDGWPGVPGAALRTRLWRPGERGQRGGG